MYQEGVSKKIFRLFIIIILLGAVITGLLIRNKGPGKDAIASLETCIKLYLNALASNEWMQSEAFLSGEALLLHQKNTMSIKAPIRGVIKEFNVQKLLVLNSNEAIVEAKSIIEMAEGQLEENNFRYYLYKGNSWRIYRVEELPDSIPERLNKEKIPLLEGVTERVIKNITAGEWHLVLNDLTGQARREAERTIKTGQKIILTDIKDLEIIPISIDGNLACFRVTYEILPSQINPTGGKITLNIRLKNLIGQWRVYRTEIIKLGDR